MQGSAEFMEMLHHESSLLDTGIAMSRVVV